MIKDSGTRREFETGAVRDIQEGKGRCDLMPLDVVCEFIAENTATCWAHPLRAISDFRETGNIKKLYSAIHLMLMYHPEWELCHSTLLLEVAKHFEEGAKKYGENNWQKGIPVHCYIDSAVRHYLKLLRGDRDEPHDRAFVWNILCCIWTCKHKPELNDYSIKDKSECKHRVYDSDYALNYCDIDKKMCDDEGNCSKETDHAEKT